MRTRSLPYLLALVTLVSSCILVTGCILVHSSSDEGQGGYSGRKTKASTTTSASTPAKRATAKIEGKSGVMLTGKATFTAVEGGVLIELAVRNAPPGWHAVHIHETGDCSADDGTSAGGHFNPGDVAHGSPHAAIHHAGDLGNMWVDDDGNGHHVILMPELTISSGSHSVVGRGIIVHAGADDLVSQPTGAAGGRIGCGVIR